jgi:hypothetical protein
MWGYGFLGLATWFASAFFGNRGIERIAKILYVLNGIVSLVGAFWTAFVPGWVYTTAGYFSFALWNLLYFVLAVVSIRVFQKQDSAVDGLILNNNS